MPDMETELVRLAAEAGRAIMDVYDAAEGGTVDADTKADDSPVTAADLAADRIIAAGLAAAFPDIPAVTEEHAASHAESGHDRFFLVDPLDGTKEFVKRGGDFTVNIALIENGRPAAGVVLAPAARRVFWTRDGGGAAAADLDETLRIAPGSERDITVREPDPAGLLVVASKSHRDAATDAFIAQFGVADFRAAGSSLKFCLLAAGEADLYPRLGRTMEWDTAAGHAVLAAAGGDVVEFERRTPLGYGKPGWENPHFIAYVPGVPL